MKMALRELSIDIVTHRGIFKSNLIALYFAFIPKTGLVFTLKLLGTTLGHLRERAGHLTRTQVNLTAVILDAANIS